MKNKKVLKSILLVFVFLTGCSPNLKVVKEDFEDDFMGSKLSTYLEDIEYLPEKHEKGSIYNYDINIKGSVNDEFVKLTTQEKFLILRDAVENLAGSYRGVECGRPDCRYGEFQLYNDENSYVMEIKEYDSDPLRWGLVLNINDSERYTYRNLKKENESKSKEINGISYFDIYMFMLNAYNSITNYGSNYNPEMHDPKVAELASEKFGITPEEAGEIYTEVDLSLN